jgi:molybdenum cofactor cytidylyltransferase
MAAGFSSRFGNENKLLVPFRGKALARHTLDLVCTMACFEEIFFVYADNEVATLAQGLPVLTVYNPSPEKGQGESALIGVRAADSMLSPVKGEYLTKADCYYLFLTCDQPLLDSGTLRLLLDAARPGCIIEPGCPGDKSGHHGPNVFSATLREELLALHPGKYPRLLKSRHPQAVITVEVPNPIVLKDIDTPSDMVELDPNSTKRQVALS